MPKLFAITPRLYAESPQMAESFNNRGSAYLRDGQLDSAITDFEKAIELHDVKGYNNLGLAYLRQGDRGLAIEYFSKALDLDQHYPNAHYNRGLANLLLQDWEGAKLDFTAATNMGMDIVATFRDRSRIISAFEQKIGVELPEDIVAMLQPN